ncbi:hypothetical protein DUNSADRAFT_10378 [Dunaliella salina]|uniref:Encoded protein n=1 Tax=Dunaliella salina TaxID=3046 RepID=A0ABQ7GFK1_DUNSA|nr:hypothetical protein DUNSADRAFT_10378 [Dunaliella salina]|eukprot:KAF5833375.1 hypothetical protein DUNSADRAFT_10378 [Dunaliella salina]
MRRWVYRYREPCEMMSSRLCCSGCAQMDLLLATHQARQTKELSYLASKLLSSVRTRLTSFGLLASFLARAPVDTHLQAAHGGQPRTMSCQYNTTLQALNAQG